MVETFGVILIVTMGIVHILLFIPRMDTPLHPVCYRPCGHVSSFLWVVYSTEGSGTVFPDTLDGFGVLGVYFVSFIAVDIAVYMYYVSFRRAFCVRWSHG